jgi:hypothetical protein
MAILKRSAFISHSYPMLYSCEELGLNEFNYQSKYIYARVPSEELALLDGAKWPIIIDNPEDLHTCNGNTDNKTLEEYTRGICTSKIIDSEFLYSPDINIDLDKCNDEEKIKLPFLTETSIAVACYFIELKSPYWFYDRHAVLGEAEDYYITHHMINLTPMHLSLVERGRAGYKSALRDTLDHMTSPVANSKFSANIGFSSEKIAVYNSKARKNIMAVANQEKKETVVSEEEKTSDKKTQKPSNKKVSSNKKEENTDASLSELTLEELTSVINKSVSSLIDDKFSSLESKISKLETLSNSSDSDDEEEELEDNEEELEDNEEEEEEETKVSNSKMKKSKTSNSKSKEEDLVSVIESSVEKAIRFLAAKTANSGNPQPDGSDFYSKMENRWSN